VISAVVIACKFTCSGRVLFYTIFILLNLK
jgi:hypothetical protein